jgi:acyl-CoA thioesterase-2
VSEEVAAAAPTDDATQATRPVMGDRYPAPDEGGPRDVADLLRLLDLEELDRDLYRAQNPEQRIRWRLYGGQVAAQAARAASLTVPEERSLHSLHGYFLRPGNPDFPIIIQVDRDRDGRSFSARHVAARQNGDVILSLLVSFHADETGFEYPEPLGMSGFTPPESIDEDPIVGHNTMFDLRAVERVERAGPFGRMPHRFWARTRGSLPDDRLLHACVLTYLSDMGTGFVKVPSKEPMGGPSIDHAVWFHRPARMDEWVLVDLEPVAASASRAYYRGSVHDGDGQLVASITQEHLLREIRNP